MPFEPSYLGWMRRVNYSSHEVKISQMLLNLYSAMFRVPFVLKRICAYAFISLPCKIILRVPVTTQNVFKFGFKVSKTALACLRNLRAEVVSEILFALQRWGAGRGYFLFSVAAVIAAGSNWFICLVMFVLGIHGLDWYFPNLVCCKIPYVFSSYFS